MSIDPDNIRDPYIDLDALLNKSYWFSTPNELKKYKLLGDLYLDLIL